MLTMFHGAATGRLLAHEPATGATEVLQEGLWFANGASLATDESFVAVVETCCMRVWRCWLTGPKVRWGLGRTPAKFLAAAVGCVHGLLPVGLRCQTLHTNHPMRPCLQAGTRDVLIDRLPGFPDNITRASDGNFWLALVIPDVPLVSRSVLPVTFPTREVWQAEPSHTRLQGERPPPLVLHPCPPHPGEPLQVHRLVRSPFLRGLAARMPDWLTPKPRWGCVIKASAAQGACCPALLRHAGLVGADSLWQAPAAQRSPFLPPPYNM